MITSHDRWFLDRVATHILAWEGEANWFWFEGNFEAYEKNKIDRLGGRGGAAAPGHLPQAHPRLTAGRGPLAASGSPGGISASARSISTAAEPTMLHDLGRTRPQRLA